MFADKPNVVVESGVFPSLYVKCNYHIIFSKFNVNVFYSPPYQRLIWDYRGGYSPRPLFFVLVSFFSEHLALSATTTTTTITTIQYY